MKFFNYKMKIILLKKNKLAYSTNQIKLVLQDKYFISYFFRLNVYCHLQIFEDQLLLTC